MMEQKIALTAPSLPEAVKELFSSEGFLTLSLPPHPCISLVHPDLVLSLLPDGSFLTDGRYRDAINATFREKIRLTISRSTLSNGYPNDILFDGLACRGTVFGKTDAYAPEFLACSAKCIPVRQGYAQCSVLQLSNGAITADVGLRKQLIQEGKETLPISPAGISLSGYNEGFIGGASCVMEKEKAVIFFGNPLLHPDGEKIIDFIRSHGYRVLFDRHTPLEDFGSAKLLEWDMSEKAFVGRKEEIAVLWS